MLASDKTPLLIDVGNIAIKWQFNSAFNLVLIKDFDSSLLPQAQKIFTSCVGDADILKDVKGVIFVESKSVFNSFKSGYQKSFELGVDRFLAMIGALYLYPNQNLLVIDAGSALTVDLVLANGQHQGGVIMPGLSKLRSSVDKFFTQSQNLSWQFLANNTKDAWKFGTAQMLISTINAQIQQHLKNVTDLTIVLTGGDANTIALNLDYQVKVSSNLVLTGLDQYTQRLIG